LSIVRRLTEESGMAVILVEQHARQILPLTRQALVLERGRSVYLGDSKTLLDQRNLLDGWLGVVAS
jgi:branched-chain amino acid transport system ATP-binding protein